MATQDTLSGTLFANRYRISRKLGGGGMADVYLAEDSELGRRVAIKVLHERYANDEQFVERFRREATHAAGLSHPNIVSIFDRGTTSEGSYYIVMEYVEGRTLKELVRGRGQCPIPVAIAYTRQILAALRYAHRNGVVHRDIKPHNVIVDAEGVVKVTDFGIARAGPSQMTEEGAIIGTAQYLSPEQARGAPVDQTSDLYSAGIVLYELLTGEVPFTGETPVEIAMKHLSEVPAPPSDFRPEVPPDLDAVVLRALAKEPADRYQSAAAMDADLETVAHGGHVPLETSDAATIVLAGGRVADGETAVTQLRRAPGYPPQYEPPPRRRTIWPWFLGVGAVLAILAGGWLVYETIQNQIAAQAPIAVPYVVGLEQAQAVNQITQKNLTPRVEHHPNADVQQGFVYAQSPTEGTRVGKATTVVIKVSSGKPQVTVPNVVGENVNDAIKQLTQAGLDAQVANVHSDQPQGTIVAQSPQTGTVVVQGTQVRINVSSGPKPITVPSVIGLQYQDAASQLQQLGFSVSRVDVDSQLAKGQVVDQTPNGGVTAAKGSTVTLSVSKGPSTTSVPDVTSQQLSIAQATLQAAGFKSQVVLEDTTDQTMDGVVISQDPAGGTQAKPAAVVTLFVGRFSGSTNQTTTTTPTS